MIRMLYLSLLLAALGASLHFATAQNPQPKTTETGKGMEPLLKKVPLDKLRFPPGAIIVVVEELKDIPFVKWMGMSLDYHQALVDQLNALRAELKGGKKPPFSCILSGELKGDILVCNGEYAFSTGKGRTSVSLGLQGAHLKEADLDGHLPNLEPNDEGFAAIVDTPGEHHLRLKFEVPVALRRSGTVGGGSERGFELSLPAAVVNRFSLELPPAVKEVRWNGNFEKKPLAGRWELKPELKDLKDKKISVSWKDPVSLPGTGPLLTANSDISVLFEETHVQVSADIYLEDLRGLTKDWNLFLPAQAFSPQGKVEFKGPAGLFQSLVQSKGGLPHVLRLTEPTSERVQLFVQYRVPRSAKLPVGPFAIDKPFLQDGTITVKAQPGALRGVRLEYVGDVHQRAVTSDTALAAFQYRLPGAGKPKTPKNVPLEIDIKKEKAQVTAELDHELRLHRAGDGYRVDATTHIRIKSLLGPADFLTVQLPHVPAETAASLAAISPTALPGTLAWPAVLWLSERLGANGMPTNYAWAGDEHPEILPAEVYRQARVRLRTLKPQTITLKGSYLLPGNTARARLEVPRLLTRPELNVLDRGAKVTVAVGDGFELLVDEAVPGHLQHTTEHAQAPSVVEFAWRQYRPDFKVTAVADVTLRDDHAVVRQELRLPAARGEKKIGKRQAAECTIPANVRLLRLNGQDAAGRSMIRLDLDTKETLAILEYEFAVPPRPDAGRAGVREFDIPWIWPEQATRIDAKVRLFSETEEKGALPGVREGKPKVWFQRGLEVVAGRDSLPVLVLQGSGLELPLRLRLHEPARPVVADLLIDRAYIQAQIDDDGHLYRARFLVQKFHTKMLELEFPIPVSSTGANVYIDRKKVTPEFDGNVLRVAVEPGLYPKSVYLDIEYRLPAGLLEPEPFWQAQLHPPSFRGRVFLPRVGWQVSLPPHLTPLVTGEDTVLDFHWDFSAGMLKPEPTVGREFEDWENLRSPTVAFWRTSLEPVRVVQVPWQLWFLACSGLLLFLGVMLTLVSSRFFFWVTLGVLSLAVLAARLLWPTLIPWVIYGVQPGILVMTAVVLVQWLLKERYRRQLVFLPGFTRVTPGSSLVRAGAGNRSAVPSTVDAPPPSSVNPAGSSVSKMV